MGYQGRFSKTKPAGGGWKKALIAVLCVVLLLVALCVAAYFYLDSKLDLITQAKYEEKGTTADLDAMAAGGQETKPDANSAATDPSETVPEEQPTQTDASEPETEAPTEATEPDYGTTGKIINIIVIGQDMRTGEDHKLADTIMLFTLNKENCTLTVTSFLRDSYVNLPDEYRGHTCGWNRINTSYALGYGWFGDEGAMDMLNVTIKNNYGIEIDGNVEINLDAFEEIVDLLGGVEIDLQGDELTYMLERCEAYGTEPFSEGVNLLTGQEALWYARMRYSNAADSDIKRAGRQRLVVDKAFSKLKSMSILELDKLLDEILPMIVTNISKEDIKTYIAELLPYVFKVELVSNQCPAEGTYWGEMVELPDGLSGVLKIDFYQNQKIMQAICEEQ